MPKNEPIDIKLEEFLQENSGVIFDTDSELKQMTDALKDHTRLVKMFKQRSEQLRHVQKLWIQGDLTSVINALNVIKDSGVVVDILNSTFSEGMKIENLSLDNVSNLLKICENISLTSKFENHLITCTKCVKNILKVYGEKILTIMKTASAMGSDINRLNDEQLDRKKKCDYIIEKLQSIYQSKGIKKLTALSKNNGNLIAKNTLMDLEFLLKNIKSLPGNNMSSAGPSSGQNSSPFKK